MASPPPTTWHPADIFSPSPKSTSPFAILILNQSLNLPSPIYSTLWSRSLYCLAADGGSNHLRTLNTTSSLSLPLDLIIGDLDSITPATTEYWKERNVPIIHDSDQDSTDFTKGVRHIKSEITEPEDLDIVVLGGLGGRVDQGMSTLHHLYTFQSSPSYSSGRMYLLSSEAVTFVLKKGKHKILVKEMYEGIGLGKHVGIIPLKEPCRITTEGLEWDVRDWETGFGGQISTSNHVREEWVSVETTGDVLFTIDLVVGN